MTCGWSHVGSLWFLYHLIQSPEAQMLKTPCHDRSCLWLVTVPENKQTKNSLPSKQEAGSEEGTVG